MAHPAANSIAIASLERSAARPLIQEIGEVNAGSHSDLDGCREPRVDLHQVRHASRIAPELDLRVSLEIDLAHERFALTSDVGRYCDALTYNRRSAHGRVRAARPP